jgi:site-specific DNA-methyltransferase (adenine-specific)
LYEENGWMPQRLNRIIVGDCINGMRQLPAGLCDLAFADPPFNIGYAYDRYEDRRPVDEYLEWSCSWMTELKRVLKPQGTFWLAIGDEYAAELKVLATRDLGFVCRSWVIWYYTFGVHCESKFTRSHAHLFHFVRDPDEFVFNDDVVRVPSARQLVYADKRANPKGRVPDDTWIIRPVADASWVLRPQDLPEGFAADSDTWYFPRVCGTFRERKGFHGCQMPEQLLGRIIKACSNDGDLVIDPFAGSGTTLAVAKKLGRRYVGFEVSPNYAKQSRKRLADATIGSPLDGSENPLASTPAKRCRPPVNGNRPRLRERGVSHRESANMRRGPRIRGLTDFEGEIINAFDTIRCGYSSDRVIADPELNAAFTSTLESRGVGGKPPEWNLALLRLRKSNRLKALGPAKRTKLDAELVYQCEFAAEIALQQVRSRHNMTLDTLLCVPGVANEFDQLAATICPGLAPLYFRWAALRIRKYLNQWRKVGKQIAPKVPRLQFSDPYSLVNVDLGVIPHQAGLYALRVGDEMKYVGETNNLCAWLRHAKDHYDFSQLSNGSSPMVAVRTLAADMTAVPHRKGAKSLVIARRRPSWNLRDLAA